MAKAYRPLPDAQLLWETFSYDPLTGRLHWLRKTGDKVIVGREAGSVSKTRGYIELRVNGVLYSAHRLVWKWLYSYDPANIDHANGQRADNRIWNLRECDQAQNGANMKKPVSNTSGFKGVVMAPAKHRQKRWVARFADTTIGYYATPEEAHAAYCTKATELHGHFHRAA